MLIKTYVLGEPHWDMLGGGSFGLALAPDLVVKAGASPEEPYRYSLRPEGRAGRHQRLRWGRILGGGSESPMIFYCCSYWKRPLLNKKCQLWRTQVGLYRIYKIGSHAVLSWQAGHAGFALERTFDWVRSFTSTYRCTLLNYTVSICTESYHLPVKLKLISQ